MANTHSGEGPANKKVRISSEKSSPAKAALQASLSAPSEFSGTKKISCLTSDSARCTFHGRLIFMRQCTSSKNTPYLCMIFLDGSGEIKGITWRENAVLWSSRLKLNEVYAISHFKIGISDPRFSRVMPGKLQLNVDQWTNIVPVTWCAGKNADSFPCLSWKVKSLGEIATMDLGDSPVVDIVGLLVNFSFDKSTNPGSGEVEAGVDDGIVDDASDKQIVLRNEIEGQEIVIGRFAFLTDDLDADRLERGKTVIRLKGVKIVKQDFPLKGDVFQDTVIELNPCVVDVPVAMQKWLMTLTEEENDCEDEDDENDRKEEEVNGKAVSENGGDKQVQDAQK